ncbi:hypothetical protein MAC_09181 [Metarhizium acridum CQMa 102]|uniref:Uncharacterized protein n=1 Tax=Metarhizium acridum (strain CQMa 102) TaxID=655827 RepID=E9EH33_METAQ|nr:uncharacterized protein MAC_09181 [Metarhizium acridum CQMa 102]EFY84778.1 hypothetical protein MAC_09181 [Metarhizium acridum CQMa 102]
MATKKRSLRVQHPAEYYRSKRTRLAKHGIVRKRHADTTKVNMHGVKSKWTRHCDHLCTDAVNHLENASKEDIMTFLQWMLDSYRRIRKRSTVHAYKRILFQVYRKSVGIDFNKEANEEINDYINGYLTIRYNLDTSINEKPVIDVNDVYLVQYHHWVHDTSVFPDERQRIQLALLILLQAYTVTRSRAVSGNDGKVRTFDTEALRYHTYLYYLQRLGLVTGFMQILNPYYIRRGSGEGIKAVATQAQLQQVMCHINAATYQAYINQRVQCDTVAAFLGSPLNKALLKAAGYMSRYINPRAPTNASYLELKNIKTDPTLVKLIELRDTLS